MGAHVVVGDAQLLEVAQEVAVQQLELVGSLLHPSAQTRTLEESSLLNSSLSEISSRSLAEVSLAGWPPRVTVHRRLPPELALWSNP